LHEEYPIAVQKGSIIIVAASLVFMLDSEESVEVASQGGVEMDI
jgi:hypothetical protein